MMAGEPKHPAVHETSPAVERASATAKERASAAGAEYVRISDWVHALLEDDESKPALLVVKLGAGLEAVREAIAREPVSETVAPPERLLYTSAREWSITLRGDPTLTTEFLLLALLNVDPTVRAELAGLGLDVERLRESLRTRQLTTAPPVSFAEPETPVPPPQPSVEPHPPEPPPPRIPAESQVRDVPQRPTDSLSNLDQLRAARVIDANLNRAREALRVLEDYTRFARNNRTASETVKQLRHRLATATNLLPAALLLSARDTPGDVGTTTTASGEYDRQSPRAIAQVNLKRLQESLRSIEEFGKLFGSEFPRVIEQIRYESYTLEQLLLGGATLRERLAEARLYVLLSAEGRPLGLERTIHEAAAGGVQVVQLREKNRTDRELLIRARDVRRWTRQAGVLFVVNDRPDIAALVEADGVHLGQDDLPAPEARRFLGVETLIGVSTHSVEQVRQAMSDGADYIGIGPTFPSQTKSFDAFPGLDFIREAMAVASIPAFALGGIGPTNIWEVVAVGGNRVAVSGAIAHQPREVAERLTAVLRTAANR